MTPRLKELFLNEIKPSFKEKYKLKNLYMVPEIEKVIINMGLGLDGNDGKIIKACEDDLAKISGQKPIITKFKKSIANFKTRKDTNAGLIKDFRGLSKKGFDNFGNFSFGIKEHIIFPEVNFEKVDRIRGLDITIVIKCQSKEHSIDLLKKFNFPFKEAEKRIN